MMNLVGQAVAAFVFPIPTSNLQIFWTLLGAQFGRSFGKKLDQGIQEGKWFISLSPTQKRIVKRLLDFTHHWWIGGFMWLYPAEIAALIGLTADLTTGVIPMVVPLTFFGFGLMVDDMRDIDNLKRRYNGKPAGDQ